MKLKTIIYPVIILLLIWIPILKYYTSTPDINACVLDYLEESNYKWYMYNINWVAHIEPLNSSSNNSLKEYRIWTANWCLMSSDNLFNDMNNTFYCTVSYLIKKSPLPDKYKEPLSILKNE